MWSMRRFCRSNSSSVLLLKAVIEKNVTSSKTNVLTTSKHLVSRRFLQTNQLLFNKSQYEYDPNTDSFRPKAQTSYFNNQNQSNSKQGKNANISSFLKRFLRNLFLITGGIVWVSVTLISLFVDVKEDDFVLHVKDFDDEVRLLAFYDIGQSKADLAKMMSKEKHLNELYNTSDHKQTSFLKVVKKLQEHETILDKLGAPVHLCGFRAAEKISHMIKSFQHLAENGLNEHLTDETNKNTWKAQCILEGTKGMGLLSLEFCKVENENDWRPVHIELHMLDIGDNILKQHHDLPTGIQL